ncbi:MAG: hypothetical protein HC836_27515 [Richelia sp. RM2_1_2]|nr:hypothetical protein [Richelia sp. SM2_1_7]NJM21550.1 hypothetical protein [Richelia sp. SM1_7_0]NJN09194.1 hypothetical protein [Richelia sp. RM1_1_1]NJO28595.1 hypothetical protein [Richelia sp. SL_2_1]NJO61853.1 hypothetical protein [Richelia sp. RM2_1_2]
MKKLVLIIFSNDVISVIAKTIKRQENNNWQSKQLTFETVKVARPSNQNYLSG